MGKAEIDKGPVDLCPAEPVRMDANRGLASEAGLRSEQVFTACLEQANRETQPEPAYFNSMLN